MAVPMARPGLDDAVDSSRLRLLGREVWSEPVIVATSEVGGGRREMAYCRAMRPSVSSCRRTGPADCVREWLRLSFRRGRASAP
jgi:hypothetical protein